jgi:hypothetical protein
MHLRSMHADTTPSSMPCYSSWAHLQASCRVVCHQPRPAASHEVVGPHQFNCKAASQTQLRISSPLQAMLDTMLQAAMTHYAGLWCRLKLKGVMCTANTSCDDNAHCMKLTGEIHRRHDTPAWHMLCVALTHCTCVLLPAHLATCIPSRYLTHLCRTWNGCQLGLGFACGFDVISPTSAGGLELQGSTPAYSLNAAQRVGPRCMQAAARQRSVCGLSSRAGRRQLQVRQMLWVLLFQGRLKTTGQTRRSIGQLVAKVTARLNSSWFRAQCTASVDVLPGGVHLLSRSPL